MNTDEIYISNFKEANANAQRGLYIGLLISALTTLLIENSYINLAIPYIESLGMLSYKDKVYCLGTTFFFSGLYTLHNYQCASKSFVNIEDSKTKSALSYYPSLMTINRILKSLLIGGIGVWFIIFYESSIVDSLYKSCAIGTAISFPYLFILQSTTSDRKKMIASRIQQIQ